MNKAYSILMSGKPAGEGIGRRIDPFAYRRSPDEISAQWHRRLVGAEGSTADQIAANTEWLIQLMLRATTREALLAVDPVNTYEAIPIALVPTVDFAAVLAQARSEKPKLQRIANSELIWTEELLWTTQLAAFTLNIVQDNAAY